MSSNGKRTAFRTCPLCEATCGLEITLEGDRLSRIQGDRDDVFSRGYLCAKGATLGHLHEDPDRLRRPRVRRGTDWHEVDWPEAFAEVERRLVPILETHGRRSVAAYFGNPNVHNLSGPFFIRPLLKALGTPNIFTASTCDQMPKHVSSGLLFGDPDLIPVPDLDRTDLLLMLGANPWHSNGSLCTAPDFPGRLKALRARGGRLVVVDPRRSRTAREADEHLAIRPGTDAVFLMSLLQVLHSEGLCRLGSLEGQVDGLEAVREWCAPFTPRAAERVTGIPAATIEGLARDLTRTPRAVVYGRIGTHTVDFGTLASWAVDAINVLTGHLDRPGGAMFPLAAHTVPAPAEPGGRGFPLGRWRSRVSGRPEVKGEMPTAVLAEEIETPGEGQIRALLTVAGNPVLSTPNGQRLEAALPGLDFMLSVDPYLNETTRHADVILPPPSPLERGHYDVAFYTLSVRNIAKYSPPILPPSGPREDEILARLTLIAAGAGAAADPAMVERQILAFMARRASQLPTSPAAGVEPDEMLRHLDGDSAPERILDLLLRSGSYGEGFGKHPGGLSLQRLRQHPHGIDLGPLTPQLPTRLQTISGRVELAAEPLGEEARRLASSLDEAVEDDAPFLLVGRRHVRSNNSWMHNVHVLVRGKDRCTLQIHPQDAAELGLSEGQSVRIRSRVGDVEAPVEVTENIRPGVVSLPHGWGHHREGVALTVASRHAGVSMNDLTDSSRLDPLSGNAVLTAVPVSLEPLGELPHPNPSPRGRGA